jgi:hypothetical protein
MTMIESRELRLSKGDEACFRVDWKGAAKGLQGTYKVSDEGVTNRLSTCDECAKSDES